MKLENIGCGHLGNGLTVWNRAVEVNGDYKKIAWISPEREVNWYMKRVPKEVRDYVENELAKSNPSVSYTQSYMKVFREEA